ncbi:MAG: hypothetical protein IKE70_00530 [Bacilli bacterium]|nr:hypothetical protein [Bacilli bacterium]
MKIKKKHIGIFIFLVLFILIVIGVVTIKNAFNPNDSKIFYGSRLKGRDKVIISDEAKKKIKEKVSEKTSKCNVRVAGRIIYITMTVNDGVSRDEAKELANHTLEYLTDKEKAYYDIQVMIAHATNQSEFPIAGYKHHTKGAFSWTKDRTAG